jgi:hypothetical protein
MCGGGFSELEFTLLISPDRAALAWVWVVGLGRKA